MNDISPKVDIVFKKIFGVEENKDLLISLINSIVSEEDKIQELKILNPYNYNDFKGAKMSILDVKAVGCNQKRYNIEMQISPETTYENRILYYWSKLYTEQLLEGNKYNKLYKTIGIHILNFSMFDLKDYHNVFYITDSKTNKRFFKNLEIHTIDLEKFVGDDKDASVYREEDIKKFAGKIKTSLDAWSAFLSRHDLYQKLPIDDSKDKKTIDKAYQTMDIMSFSYEERDAYEAHLKWLRAEAAAVDFYVAEGEKIGIEKGIVQGKVEGIKEVVKNMLDQNLSIQAISSITKLSEDEIEKIKKEEVFKEHKII